MPANAEQNKNTRTRITQPAIGLPRLYLDGIAFLASYWSGGLSYLAGLSYTGSRWWF
jgi:hypothetical protein